LQSFFYKCDYNGGNLGQILRFCEQKVTVTIMNLVEEKKKPTFLCRQAKNVNLPEKQKSLI
jgi:hypothetical protein